MVQEKWVIKSRVSDSILGMDSKYWCETQAEWMNDVYKTDQYYSEPFNPRKSWLK